MVSAKYMAFFESLRKLSWDLIDFHVDFYNLAKLTVYKTILMQAKFKNSCKSVILIASNLQIHNNDGNQS